MNGLDVLHVEKIGVSALCPEAGPPLKAFLFNSDRDDDYEKYAEKTITALWNLIGMYPGLSFHRRVALLMPDDDFLTKFKKTFQTHLNLRFPRRVFDLESFEDSLAILPNQKQKETAEVMVIDTVEKAKGLEKLFVFCIALDKPLGSQRTNCETRAKIYQALTRAQLQVVVVNQRLEGGWLEFLGLVKLKKDDFDEVSAMAETTTEAASRSISQWRGHLHIVKLLMGPLVHIQNLSPSRRTLTPQRFSSYCLTPARPGRLD